MTESILVTGGAGFIGSHLVDELMNRGYKVCVIDDLSTGSLKNIDEHRKNPNFCIFKEPLDIVLNNISLRKWLHTFTFKYIFHLAAIPSVRLSYINPAKTSRVNVQDTVQLLEFAREIKVKRFVFASSCAVYGNGGVCDILDVKNPLSLYALTKHIGEQYCRMYYDLFNLPITCLRFFNVYGPRARFDSDYSAVILKFLKQAALRSPFTLIGDKRKCRDFIYVTDVVKALISSGFEKNLPIGNVGTCNFTSLEKLMKDISKLVNNEETYKIINLEETPGEVFSCKAGDSIVVNPISLEEGLKKTYEYMNKME